MFLRLLNYYICIMQNFILFVLATSGLTHAVTRSSLFRGIREHVTKKAKNSESLYIKVLDEVLNCQFCFGFYSGIFFYLIIYMYNVEAICYPFIGALASLSIHQVIQKLK